MEEPSDWQLDKEIIISLQSFPSNDSLTLLIPSHGHKNPRNSRPVQDNMISRAGCGGLSLGVDLVGWLLVQLVNL